MEAAFNFWSYSKQAVCQLKVEAECYVYLFILHAVFKSVSIFVPSLMFSFNLDVHEHEKSGELRSLAWRPRIGGYFGWLIFDFWVDRNYIQTWRTFANLTSLLACVKLKVTYCSHYSFAAPSNDRIKMKNCRQVCIVTFMLQICFITSGL